MSTSVAVPSLQNQCGGHWTNLLRCPVCFSFFYEPVTLYCGHTFCKGCMRRMAHMVEGNNPDMSLHRLRMWCPTCRHGVPAMMFLRNDANISFVLRDLVEGWRAERNKLTTSGQVMVHSVSTQTSHSGKSKQHKSEQISKEECYLKIRSDITYLQAAILTNDSDNSSGDTNDNRQIYPRFSNSESTLEDIHAVGQLEEESDDENDVGQGQVQEEVQMAHMRNGHGDWSPSRTLMVIVWATYTLVILLLAQNYLPYMFLYSVLFLMILYTERLPNRYAL